MTKILALDIEWRPTLAYVWGAYDQTITPEKIKEHGGLLCIGLKWVGDKNSVVLSEWKDGHKEMLQKTHDMIMEADAIITYNGDRFDLKKLEGEFVLNNIGPMPPVTSIDCLKAVKKFGFFMNKLAFIGPFLGLGSKVSHEGMSLWTKTMGGDKKAQAKMEKYCRQDVILLEKLYKKILPYIKNHPFIGNRGACGACEGTVLHSRGYRRTKSFKIQRLQCQNCGSWQDGKKEKVA